MLDFTSFLTLLAIASCYCIYPAWSQPDLGRNSEQQNSEENNGGLAESKAIAGAGEIPAPPAIALPEVEPTISGEPSVSLAWRSRAFALANEYPVKKNTLVWVLPVAYNNGASLLRQATSELGLEILAQYTEAGQFLISADPGNTKTQIIVISQPASRTSTLFRMCAYNNGRATENKKASSLPETMKNLLANQGLWQ